jgi:cystathionine beta-lyase
MATRPQEETATSSADLHMDHMVKATKKRQFLKAKAAFDTRCVQGDSGVTNETGHAPAIQVSTTYSLDDPTNTKFIYARANAPTRARLEAAYGAVEGGSCIAYASGMAAISSVFSAYNPAVVLIENAGYTGTKSFLAQQKGRFEQVETFEELEKHSGTKKMVYCEAVRNPDSQLCNLTDLVSKSKALNALVVVDNTFGTAVLCRPLTLGADVVIHSASKFIGGHSDVLAGLVVTNNMALHLNLHKQRMWMGNVLGNLEAFLLLRFS